MLQSVQQYPPYAAQSTNSSNDALETVRAAMAASRPVLMAEHRQWWSDFWDNSALVSLPDTVLESFYAIQVILPLLSAALCRPQHGFMLTLVLVYADHRQDFSSSGLVLRITNTAVSPGSSAPLSDATRSPIVWTRLGQTYKLGAAYRSEGIPVIDQQGPFKVSSLHKLSVA